MDKQLLVANPSGKSSRPISFVWAVFTEVEEPWKQKSAPCRHCQDVVTYHRKSEYVLAHLKNCLAFHDECERTKQSELLKFVITSAKVTNSRRRVARLDAAHPILEPLLNDREEPFLAGSAIDMRDYSANVHSGIPYDFVRRGINRLLLSVSADEAAKAFEGAHPLGYGDSTKYFTSRLARFLIKYGGRQMVNANCLFPCGGVSDGLNKLITYLQKRSGFRPGAVAFVEDTTDSAKVSILKDRGVYVKTVRTDDDGFVVADLDRQLRLLHEPLEGAIATKTVMPWPLLVFLTPTFTAPGGKTLSYARRIELLHLTSAYNVPVVSDESCAFLEFTRELLCLRASDNCQGGRFPLNVRDTAAEPIFALADLGFRNVFTLSSFSHVLAPGLRVGWIETSNEDDRYCLSTSGVESSGGCICYFASSVVAYLMENSDGSVTNESKLYAHICRLRDSFALRYRALTQSIFKHDRMFFPDNGEGGDGSGLILPGYNAELETDNGMSSYWEPTLVENSYRESVGAPKDILGPPGGRDSMHLSPSSGISASFVHPVPIMPSIMGPSSLGPLSTAGLHKGIQQPMHQYLQHCAYYGLPMPPLIGGNMLPAQMPLPVDMGMKGRCVGPSLRNCIGMDQFSYCGGTDLVHPKRVGGFFLRVQLPQWLVQLSKTRQQPSQYVDDEACDHPAKRHRRDPASMQWFLDKARNDYLLDFRLDEEDASFGNPGYAPASSERFVYLCFARLPTAALEEAGRRFCALLSELFALDNEFASDAVSPTPSASTPPPQSLGENM